MATKTALDEILKGTLCKGETNSDNEKKGSEKTSRDDKRHDKMAISPYLSIIILNVSGLNAPVKRHKMTEWMKTTTSFVYMLPTRVSSQT